jgi:hypothetical protein
MLKGDLYKIFVIEPNNYHFNDRDVPVENFEEELTKLETNERILSILKSTNIFIHEHYEKFGLFNTSKESAKNIYQFGITPDMDISVPNFHDHWILENDYQGFAPCPDDYIQKGEAEIDKFCTVCELSSFPEFAQHFKENWRSTRFFWRPNHVSAAFTIYIFRRMNSRFLNLNLTDDFWNPARQEDLFSYPCTQVTQRDRDGYDIKW